MSVPPSGLSTPPAGGTAPAPSRGGRRKWLLLPVLGLVMLLLAGVGGYLGAVSYEGSQASQSCDIYKCIPRLEAATVVRMLQEQGHTCTEDFNHRNCDLRIGIAHFESSLQVADGLITAIDVSVFRAGSEPVSATGLAYMNWFATLPYARDPDTSAQIEAWVAEQVNGNKDTQAIIGDYEYRLTNPETYDVMLHIEGNFS